MTRPSTRMREVVARLRAESPFRATGRAEGGDEPGTAGREADYPGAGRLTVRAVARRHGVSKQTAQKALQCLAAEGGAPGTAGGAPMTPAPLSTPTPVSTPAPVSTPTPLSTPTLVSTPARARPSPLPGSSARVRQLEKKLRDLLFAECAGPEARFPAQKTLLLRFGCGHRVLLRALQPLLDEGLLERSGTFLQLPRRESAPALRRGSRSHLYLVASNRESVLNQPERMRVVHALERELAKRGWPRLRWFFSADPCKDAGLPADHEVSAFVYFRLGCSPWPDYLRRAGRGPGIPSVTLDLQATPAQDEADRTAQQFLLFPSQREAGREMGRHLLSLGHRRIAFFSHFDVGGDGWESERFRGLCDIFPGAVTLFTAARVEAEGLASLREALGRGEGACKSLSRFPPAVVRHFTAPGWRFLSLESIALALDDAFTAALTDPSLTAWVGMNDEAAAAARAFLERQGVAVPGSVAVTGFDNTPLAYSLGLTSYDFNLEAYAAQALDFIEAPERFSRFRERRMEVAGQLIARASS